MKFTTNDEIRAALANAVYRSMHTGQEIDQAVDTALGLQDYIDRYMMVPFSEFTGDYERQILGSFDRNVWLHSIVINCTRPFSKSVYKYKYWVEMIDETDAEASGRLIDEIPLALMITEGLSVEFEIDRWLPAKCTVYAVGESINAFGQIDIKLIIS